MGLDFIDQEIKNLEAQLQDASHQAQEWANTSLRVEGALAYMRQLRGRLGGIATLQPQEGQLHIPVRQSGDDESQGGSNGNGQPALTENHARKIKDGPMPNIQAVGAAANPQGNGMR